MTYSEAKIVKENNLHLIGTTSDKGIIYDNVIIVPLDVESRNDFFRNLLWNNNPEVSILPYISQDVEVWAISLKTIHLQNILVYRRIE